MRALQIVGVMMPNYKINGVANQPVKYDSVPTRYTSLDHFMGDARINETYPPPQKLPCEVPENLEQRFVSGANRTDMPRMWGYPNVKKQASNNLKFLLSDDIASWRREHGLPLYKK